MMNKRERYLAFIVLAIAGSYGLFILVKGAFLGPLDAQTDLIRNLTNDLATKKQHMVEAKKASEQLAEWEKISLPDDPGAAQALYQDFLFRLLADCRFDDAKLWAEKVQGSSHFTIIPFTIRGNVTLENLTEFLYRFYKYQPQLLHQVRSLTVNRPSDSSTSKNLAVTIMVAGLALKNAPARDQIVTGDDDSTAGLVAGLPRENFMLISKRNIFEPYKEPEKVVEKKDPEIDAAIHVRLTGCPQSEDEPEAWIFNRLTNERKVLFAGDEFDIAGVKGKIVSVAPTGIVIAKDNKEWSLKLGKTLKDLKEIASAIPAVTKPSEPVSEPPSQPKTEPASGEANPAIKDSEGKPADDKPAKVGENSPSPKPPTDLGHEADKISPGG